MDCHFQLGVCWKHRAPHNLLAHVSKAGSPCWGAILVVFILKFCRASPFNAHIFRQASHEVSQPSDSRIRRSPTVADGRRTPEKNAAKLSMRGKMQTRLRLSTLVGWCRSSGGIDAPNLGKAQGFKRSQDKEKQQWSS